MMDRNISASGRFWIALFGFLLLMQCGLVAQTAPASKFVFPRFLSFEEQSTGIAIFNPSLQTASVTLTLRTWDGRLVTDVENPVTLFVPARGQVARTSGELFGSGQVIDAVLEITSATAGLAASYQTFDPGMTLLDGGIAPEASTALILPVIPSSAEGMSEIDFVNPNTREASVELKLWSFEGSLLGTATIQVPGGGNYRNLTDYVFPSGTSFSRASHITATSKPRNVLSGVQSVAATSLFAGFSSSAPVGGYVDLAGLNAVPLTRATTTGAIPYFHTGGHFASTLCLVNVEAASVNVSVTAIDNEGGTLGTRTVSIAAQGGLRQSLEGFLTALGSGEHEGWLLVQSSGRLAGAVVHGWSTAASLAAAPLQKSPKAEFVFPQVVESAGMLTEISLVNPSPSGASALIHLVAPDGTTLATGTLALGPNQRVSRTIHQLLPEVDDLPGGILHVEASGSLFATATIWTDTGSLASNLEPQDTSYLPAPLGTFAVTGRVTVNDQPAKDFVVVLSGAADRQTLTDEDGLYAFAHVVAGEYTLKVSQLGFQLLPPEVTFEITDTSVRQDFSGVTFGDAILVKPSYLPVGGNDATLSVFGNGFNAGSRAYAGGILLKTEYVNSSQLLAVLPAYMMAEPASFEVSVVTEESGISVVSQTCTVLVYQDLPALDAVVTPGPIGQGSPATNIQLVGTGFLQGAAVKINGISDGIVAEVLDDTLILVHVPASYFEMGGYYPVTVQNPYPPDAESNIQLLAVHYPGAGVEQVAPGSTTARLEPAAGALNIEVFGYGFRRGAVVVLENTPLVTSYCETDAYCLSTHLYAKVPAELLQRAGFAKVEVQNPEPSLAGLSDVYLRIDGLAPTITSVQPGSATLSDTPFDFEMVVMVSGMNFGPDTLARAYQSGTTPIPNFEAGSVEVLNSTQMIVRVRMQYPGSLGEWQIQVANLPPGGGMSETVSFMITEAAFIPSPFLVSLSPGSVAAGGPAFRLTVNGFNFKAGTVVYFNSAPLVTTVVNDHQLQVDVPAFLIRTAGRVPVFVANPDTGGASNRLFMEIR